MSQGLERGHMCRSTFFVYSLLFKSKSNKYFMFTCLLAGSVSFIEITIFPNEYPSQRRKRSVCEVVHIGLVFNLHLVQGS
jgi:hypothetical protein